MSARPDLLAARALGIALDTSREPWNDPASRRSSATTAASLRAELAHLERRRRHTIELEALCDRKRRGHEEAVRQLDLAIEALEVELDR